MITSEQPLGGTIHDMFRYTGCDRVDVDSGLPTYIVQHLLSMLEFCHSKQVWTVFRALVCTAELDYIPYWI